MQYLPSFELSFLGIVLITFCVAVLIQILYLLIFNLRLLCHKYKPDKSSFEPPISLIVCARNEEDNLFNHLPSLLNQVYSKFEVIVVNDQSQDDSNHIVKAYQKEFSNLRLIELEKNKHRKFGKKIPLTIGIKGAKHGLIMLTDADCKPNSKYWLKEMASTYTSKKQMIIGYGPFYKRKGFLNKFIRFDMVSAAISYLSAAKTGLPYMGVGRNMGYSKEMFIDNEGFKNHYHIASGDDDLLMQEIGDRKNVAININPNTFVYSEAKPTLNTWLTQKQRHFTTAPEYKLINKLFLGIFPFTLYLAWFSFFILLFNTKWALFIVCVLVFRYALYWLINGLLIRRLKMKDLVWFYPFFELLHVIVMPFIYYAKPKRDKKAW